MTKRGFVSRNHGNRRSSSHKKQRKSNSRSRTGMRMDSNNGNVNGISRRDEYSNHSTFILVSTGLFLFTLFVNPSAVPGSNAAQRFGIGSAGWVPWETEAQQHASLFSAIALTVSLADYAMLSSDNIFDPNDGGIGSRMMGKSGQMWRRCNYIFLALTIPLVYFTEVYVLGGILLLWHSGLLFIVWLYFEEMGNNAATNTNTSAANNSDEGEDEGEE